jgi:hypothetical protein
MIIIIIIIMVDCTGIDFLTLHKTLWDNSKIAAFFEVSGMAPPNYEKPRTGEWGFDYHCGRVFKTSFEPYRDPSKRINGKIIIDPSGYDRDNGNGAFQRVVNSFRSAQGSAQGSGERNE